MYARVGITTDVHEGRAGRAHRMPSPISAAGAACFRHLNGVAVFRTVELGTETRRRRSARRLDEGDQVITTGARALRDGDRILLAGRRRQPADAAVAGARRSGTRPGLAATRPQRRRPVLAPRGRRDASSDGPPAPGGDGRGVAPAATAADVGRRRRQRDGPRRQQRLSGRRRAARRTSSLQ